MAQSATARYCPEFSELEAQRSTISTTIAWLIFYLALYVVVSPQDRHLKNVLNSDDGEMSTMLKELQSLQTGINFLSSL